MPIREISSSLGISIEEIKCKMEEMLKKSRVSHYQENGVKVWEALI